ncbi:MAG: UDP-2,3-diacylglucosamine diphosphatase [Candidatus Methanospirareceae archaeon]
MTKTCIVVSDLHLGIPASNKSKFMEFLDELPDDVERLILLGDIFDLWRRDPLGVMLDNTDILEKLMSLEPRIDVTFVVGNHDYHAFMFPESHFGTVFDLDPLRQRHDLALQYGETTYHFIHGYQLENKRFGNLELYELFADRLCMEGDDVGKAADTIWQVACAKADLWNKLIVCSWVKDKATRITLPPEERDLEKLPKYATDLVRKGGHYEDGFVIYGHTHKPYVNIDERTANSGSWVGHAADYLVISDEGVTHETYL